MFPPTPTTFAGSMPDTWEGLPRLAREVELSISALSLLACTASGVVAWQMAGLDWGVLKAACAGLLVPASVGIWLQERTAAAPSMIVNRLYRHVLQIGFTPGPAADAVQVHDNAWAGLAALITGTDRRLQHLRAGLRNTRAASERTAAALQAGRDKAAHLASTLRGDGAAMSEAATGVLSDSIRLIEDTAAASAGADKAEQAASSLARRAMALTASVSDVTAQINRMTDVAVRAAEAAFGAQGKIAGLEQKIAALSRTADQVGRALQLAGACGRRASEAVESGVPADLAANLAEMARCAEHALTSMQIIVAELRVETAAATRRAGELSELIHSQHELGHALSHAVTQQGDEITTVLNLAGQTQDGMASLRACVDTLGARNNARLAGAETLRGAAERLPGHAETIAAILRAIPDFAPPLEY